jgi:DNA-binding protein H-NS
MRLRLCLEASIVMGSLQRLSLSDLSIIPKQMATTSTPTLKELKAQIAALQAQAEEVKRKETADVIDRIKEAIEFYGLTASDLGLGRRPPVQPGKAPPKPPPKAVGKKATGVAKYTDGAGRTWTGHGKRPRWFVDALAAGKSSEDMLVGGRR